MSSNYAQGLFITNHPMQELALQVQLEILKSISILPNSFLMHIPKKTGKLCGANP